MKLSHISQGFFRPFTVYPIFLNPLHRALPVRNAPKHHTMDLKNQQEHLSFKSYFWQSFIDVIYNKKSTVCSWPNWFTTLNCKCEMLGLLLRVLCLQPKTKGVSNNSFCLSSWHHCSGYSWNMHMKLVTEASPSPCRSLNRLCSVSATDKGHWKCLLAYMHIDKYLAEKLTPRNRSFQCLYFQGK